MRRRPKHLKRKVNPTTPIVSRCYTEGQRVIGLRSPKAYHGVFVRAYATLNGTYRNPAYVIKCDVDGKERAFQGCRDESRGAEGYTIIR